MSEVVSFKIRKDVKRKMEEFKGEVNWPEELRKFVEMKIRELEARRSKEIIRKRLKAAKWSVPKEFSSSITREDRDGH